MDSDRTAWASTLVKNNDENKTYILVKLSESFSHAIQEYSAPTIKFYDQCGAIKFHNGKSYDFSLEQSDVTVECIKQTKNRWESVGKIASCLQVKGKDDVYQRTRTKMEVAEKEKRKNCAKLLGSPEHQQDQLQHSSSKPSISNNNNRGCSSSNTITNATNNTINNTTSNKIKTSTTTTTTTATASATTNNNTNNNIRHNNGSTNNNNNINNNNYVNHSDYPDITDVKQMKKYKAEFDRDFKEYQHLHGYLQRIEERFKKLRESLIRSAEGSKEWESAKEEIFNEYERFKGDSNFHKARSKYNQLYNKLAHIKAKIFQFKREHRDKCNIRKKRKR